MTACLIISFARSRHLKQIIESAKAHNEKVYIYQNCKVSKYADGCDLVSAEIEQHLDDKTYYFRPRKHLRSESSIVYAISEFFKIEEIGTILEDDCIPSDNFWKLRNYFLQHHQNQYPFFLNGYNPVPKQKNPCTISQVAYMHVWGWTANKIVWDQFLKNYKIGKIISSNNFIYLKDLKSRAYWIIIFWMVKNKQIMTWDYKFLFFIWKHRISIYGASENFITNDGFDEYATFLKASKLESANLKANTENLSFVIDNNFDDARTSIINTQHYQITWSRIFRMLMSAFYYKLSTLYK